MKRKVSYRFSKNTQISNFMKIRPVLDELFLADGQTRAILRTCIKKGTSLNNINLLVFQTETECVYCVIRAESLIVIRVTLSV